LVAKVTCSGMPALVRRSVSSAQTLGR
jgi:hypothetical protein